MILRTILLLSAFFCALTLADTTQKQKQLADLSKSHGGNIKLTPETFKILTESPRAWSSAVHFTAGAPKRGCQPCKQFTPSFNSIASSWSKFAKSQDRASHYFATVDYDDEGSISAFEKHGVRGAPALLIFPKGSGEPIRYNFEQGFEPRPLAAALSRYTPAPIPYQDPVDYTKYLFTGIAVGSGLVFLRYLRPLIVSKIFWGALTIISSIIFTCGYMFTRIRGMPWQGQNGSWILAKQYSNQYGQETQVIAIIYAFLAGTLMMMIMVVPYQKNPGSQRLQAFLWTAAFMIGYSVLVAIFKVKHERYPFSLLL